MHEPRASRPAMPGYGILGPRDGTGLLPWTWAAERLTTSRNYWLATVWPDGRPHVMPVWGVWHDDRFWCSSSRPSRKVRNLQAEPRCVVTTEHAQEPVVFEGTAAVVTEPAALAQFLELVNTDYGTTYGMEMVDPARNATIQVQPRWAFGLRPARSPTGRSGCVTGTSPAPQHAGYGERPSSLCRPPRRAETTRDRHAGRALYATASYAYISL